MRTFKVELKQKTKIEGYLAVMNRFQKGKRERMSSFVHFIQKHLERKGEKSLRKKRKEGRRRRERRRRKRRRKQVRKIKSSSPQFEFLHQLLRFLLLGFKKNKNKKKGGRKGRFCEELGRENLIFFIKIKVKILTQNMKSSSSNVRFCFSWLSSSCML